MAHNEHGITSFFDPQVDYVAEVETSGKWVAVCGGLHLHLGDEVAAEAFFVEGLRKLREAQGVTATTGHVDDLLDRTLGHRPDVVATGTTEVRELQPGDLVQLRGRWLEVAAVHATYAGHDGTWHVRFTDGTGERLQPTDAVQIGRRLDPCGGGDLPVAEPFPTEAVA